MIEELGVIKKVDQDHIWVETQIKTTCGGCVANQDCGTGTIARAMSPRSQTLVFRCSSAAQVGQKVRLGIPESSLVSASALMYLLPLLVLMGAALLGQWLMTTFGIVSELAVIGVAVGATALCFVILRRVLHQQSDQPNRYQPRLLELMPFRGDSIDVQTVKPQ